MQRTSEENILKIEAIPAARVKNAVENAVENAVKHAAEKAAEKWPCQRGWRGWKTWKTGKSRAA